MYQIRLKRLAKLQAASSNTDSPSSAGPSTPASPPPKPQSKPTPSPRITYASGPKRPSEPSAVSPVPLKKVQALRKLDLQSWEDETLGVILKVTLQVRETPHPSLISDSNLLCNISAA